MHPHCALCDRQARLTFHHFIPRTLHSNKWFQKNFSREQMREGMDVCRQCHVAIHESIEEKDLGRTYNTRERLLEHPEIQKFVRWVRRQRVKHEGRK